jgi:hypothetical protein
MLQSLFVIPANLSVIPVPAFAGINSSGNPGSLNTIGSLNIIQFQSIVYICF